MSVRTIVAILLALVCGVAAAVGVNKLRSNSPTAQAAPETVPVVVAAVNIQRGVTIGEGMLTTRDWPKNFVPPGAALKPEDVTGRVALYAMLKDETILSAKLASKDAGRGMAPFIPEGMRAYAIRTRSASSGVAGFILPGNHVDVLLTVTDSRDDNTGGGSTWTLLQNVEILAVNQLMEAPSENKVSDNLNSVTLLVTPDQVGMLSLAQTRGELNLALRNDADEGPAETAPITMRDLRFLQQGPLMIAEPETEAPEEPQAPPAEATAAPVAQLASAEVVERPEPLVLYAVRGASRSVIYVQRREK